MNQASDNHIFIFAGEMSGDIHGARLIQELKSRFPDFAFSGVSGPEMRNQGIFNVMNMEDFSVMGFSDVLAVLPRLWKQFNRIRDFILQTQPKIVIFIDSASFSLRMARKLRKLGFKGKLVQYISPAVWAWGKDRIKTMADNLDLLLTIYPFENKHFANTALKTVYVGNPIKERISKHQYDPDWKQLLGIKQTENLIALFPGSRASEIKKNLPIQLNAAKLIKKKNPEAIFAISCAHDHHLPLVQQITKQSHLKRHKEVFFVPISYSYELMNSCHSAIAKSGTVTLELALHKCPTVVMYELSKLNRFIAKYILRLRLSHYCIVNILAGKTIFPEFISHSFTPQNISKEILHFNQPEFRTKCQQECKEVDEILQVMSSSEKAAQAIVGLL